MFCQTHVLATHLDTLERERIDIHYACVTVWSHTAQNVGTKCPPPLQQAMNHIKISLRAYPTTVLTSESWLVLRTITVGPPLGIESKSLFCNPNI